MSVMTDLPTPSLDDHPPTALELKLRRKARISATIRYTLLIVVGLVMIYPLIWLIGASFKTNAEMFSSTKRRSASVTPSEGFCTRVSVVPTQVLGPMGITKNNRPSLAKKVSTRWWGVTRSTIR